MIQQDFHWRYRFLKGYSFKLIIEIKFKKMFNLAIYNSLPWPPHIKHNRENKRKEASKDKKEDEVTLIGIWIAIFGIIHL